jgi:NDP-sugar pyrophosphorylase family protein
VQVVVLAGGKGTRLFPMTRDIPKPMVSIKGKPFLEYQLRLLRKQGYADVLLCVGYLARQIKEYFGDGASFGLRIAYAEEQELRGTGGALRQAYDALADRFLLLNGDTYLDVPYRQVIACHEKEHAEGTVVVYNNLLKLADNNIERDGDGRIMRYGCSLRANCVDAGVYVIEKKTVSVIELGREISLREGIFESLIRKRTLVGHLTGCRYYDIGTFERIKVFQEEVAV